MSRKTFLLAAASVAGSSHSGAAAAMLAQSLMDDDRKVDSLTLEREGLPGRTAPARRSRTKRIGRVLRVLVKAAA